MAIDYISEIKQKSTSDLLTMLSALSAGQKITDWPAGKAFEHIIIRAFDLEGADVIWPYTVLYQGKVIEQIDGAVYYHGLSCLIEAKDYSDPLNIEPMAKLRNQLMRRPSSTLGLVFTKSEFSEPAKSLIRMMNPLGILLWDYNELEIAITQQKMCRALQTKFRYAVEHGAPDYNIKVGII